ncbi:hypothetical protein FEK33_12455 [Nocardia asteroides NBRC 15531]|nr:hypothetical protein FEK33_12455 [Nocardia asteroides NBRC 15531]SFN02362.1 Peptidase inhibitor family I36 [Nocardia asteroides]VEG35166.1 Uncharacterised protein [Nocardia asteroides]
MQGHHRFRIHRLLAGLFAVPLLVLNWLGAGPANAELYCDEGSVCFWAGSNYQGDWSVLAAPGDTCISLPKAHSSIWNRTDVQIWFYTDSGCREPGRWLEPEGYTPDTEVPVRSMVAAQWVDLG